MRLVNSKYNLKIEFEENKSTELVVENKECMIDIVQNLLSQVDGIEGDFVLAAEKEMKMEKDVLFIIDPFSVDFNNKKIITKLYEQLSQIAKEENEGYDSINSEIVSTLEKICGCVEYSNVQYDLEFDWKNLFKLYNVRIGEDYKNIYEKLEDYIKILVDVLKVKLIIFLNLMEYLPYDKIDNIRHIGFYKKVSMLFIESEERKEFGDNNIFIIDKDRCLIVK